MTTDRVVIDNLLCFIANKWAQVSVDELKLLIRQSFTSDIIATSREVLQEQIRTAMGSESAPAGGVFAKSASEGNLDFIFRMFSMCEKSSLPLPTFAATNLNHLPSMSANGGQPASFTPRDLVLGQIIHELTVLKEMVLDIRNRCLMPDGKLGTLLVDSDRGIHQEIDTVDQVVSAVLNHSMDSSSIDPNSTTPTSDGSAQSQISPMANERGASATPPPSISPGLSTSLDKHQQAQSRKRRPQLGILESTVAKIKASIKAEPPEGGVKPGPSPKGEGEPGDAGFEGHQSTTDDPVQTDPLDLRAGAAMAQSPAVSMVNNLLKAYGLSQDTFAHFGIPLPPFSTAPFASPASVGNFAGLMSSIRSTSAQVSEGVGARGGDSGTSQNMSTVFPPVGSPPMGFPSLPTSLYLNLPSMTGNSGKTPSPCGSDVTPTPRGGSAAPNGEFYYKKSSSEGYNRSPDTGEKPYVCQHSNCCKRFANKFLLKKHEFIHTGERPHQCPFCGKRFNRKDNLLRHKKTHITNFSMNRRRSSVFGLLPPAALAMAAATNGYLNDVKSEEALPAYAQAEPYQEHASISSTVVASPPGLPASSLAANLVSAKTAFISSLSSVVNSIPSLMTSQAGGATESARSPIQDRRDFEQDMPQ